MASGDTRLSAMPHTVLHDSTSPFAKGDIPMKSLLAALSLTAAALAVAVPAAAAAPAEKPTIVLVHGAFADASSWNGVISVLLKDGFHVIAPPNPLRGPASDGAGIHALLATIH